MYFGNVDVDEITNYLLSSNQEGAVYLILLASEDMFSAASLIDLFKMKGIKFAGGIFPYVIDEGKVRDHGVIINRYPGKGKSFVIEGLRKGQQEMAPLVDYVKKNNPQTAFVMIDGLSEDLSAYLSEMYRYLGTSVKYFGAAAGASDLVQKPVLLSEKGLIENGMVVMFSDCDAVISVKHGWRPFKGPLLVTESEKNRVKSLNWRNAFEVYKEQLREKTGPVSRENFRDKSNGFPLGLHREDSGAVIRTPIMVNKNNELVCMGNVDENALIYIMDGDENSLCKAAAEATGESLKQAVKARELLIFESISRYRFLGKNITKELQAIKNEFLKYPGSKTVCGALGLGNVASLPSGYLEFFSKSVLIGVFDEEC